MFILLVYLSPYFMSCYFLIVPLSSDIQLLEMQIQIKFLQRNH